MCIHSRLSFIGTRQRSQFSFRSQLRKRASQFSHVSLPVLLFVVSHGVMPFAGQCLHVAVTCLVLCLLSGAQLVAGQVGSNSSNATTPGISTPRQRFGHSAVLLPNRSMLLFGGHNYQRTDVELKLYVGLKNDLWLFDLDTASYSAVIPLFNASVPPPRVHHSAVLLTDPNGTASD